MSEKPADRHRRALLAARPYLVVLGLSTFVVTRWFRTGTFIATGDMGPFIRRGWTPELLWSWSHQQSGAGSATHVVARGFEFVLIWIFRSIGLGEYTAQWMFYVCIYGLVAFGVAYLAGAFVRSQPAIVVAGAFGILNGFFLTRLPNPLNIISVGSIALLTGVAMRVAQGRRFPAPAAGLVLIPTSFLSFNPPMLVVAYAWAVAGTPLLALLVLGRRPAWRLLLWLARASPWAILLNAWWLVPLAQAYTGGGGATSNATFTDPTNWLWSQVNNLPPNILTLVANWAWFRPQYLPFAEDLDQPWWIWIRYLLPALVFVAPAVAVRAHRRLALGLLALVIVFVGLAKGLRPPLIGINLLLYEYVPGFWLFREPMSKLGQLLVCFYGVLLAVFVQAVLHRLRTQSHLLGRARRLAYAAGLVPVALTLAYPHPLYTGAVMPDERPTQPSAHVRVPQEWWDVAELIDSNPRPGKVLVLPLADYYQMPTTWGFFGVDSIANLLLEHPVVQFKPDGYFSDGPGFSAAVRGIETALLAGDLEAVPRLAHAIGVAKVIIRHDLVRGLPGRSFADDRTLTAAMARVPGAKPIWRGMLEVWELGDGSSPTVRTYGRVVDGPARAEATAALLGTLDTSVAVSARRDTTAPAASPLVDDAVAVTDEAVHWPVPAVDSGEPKTTVTLAEGLYTVAQRARGPAVLTPRVDTARGVLVLEDRAVVTIDGRVVSRRPPLTVPLPGRTVVAVRADARTVSLDGWGRERLPGATGGKPAPATLPVGANTKLTLFAPSTTPADVGGYSEVFDCNAYEPRPAAELELASEVTRTAAGEVVRLSAADHAACTQVVVRDAKPGRTYRIRLEYRRVAGNRPQVCLLQTGTDGCALAAKAADTDGWIPYEQILTVAEGATGLQVILHADVGARLRDPTISEYRGLRIEALDAIAEQAVFPPAVPPVSVSLKAGQHELRVEGGLAGSVLAPFEPLADCFRYDDRTPEEAGLFARTTVGADGETTYTLGAVGHLACIAATAPDFGASSLYELSMQARSVAGRNPKFCLYSRGPDQCRTLPKVGRWDGWTPYEALLTPDPAAVETRLYLYGLRDLKEAQQTEVEYREVRLRPVASPTSVVMVRESVPREPAGLDWSRRNPATFTADVTSEGPAVLALAENAAPGWSIRGKAATGAERVTLQGWMNGWRLPTGGPATLVYAPASISRAALYLLPVAAVAAAGWTVAAPWAGRWLRRRAWLWRPWLWRRLWRRRRSRPRRLAGLRRLAWLRRLAGPGLASWLGRLPWPGRRR